MADRPVLLWFRNDLRLDDHPAVSAAAADGAPLVALYVNDPALDGRPLGGAARWWLHHSLESLGKALAKQGVPLVLRRGDSALVVAATAHALDATAVHWTTGHTPFLTSLDTQVEDALRDQGIAARRAAPADLLAGADAIRTGAGQPYRVFTPFWNALRDGHAVVPPVPAPTTLRGPKAAITGDALDDWELLPHHPDWADGLRTAWTPGEDGARARLEAFVQNRIDRYPMGRDIPSQEATSRLSPHLRFGELSPRRLWHAVKEASPAGSGTAFLRELAWREFCHSLLFQHPEMAIRPLRPDYEAFPWREDAETFRAWTQGRTGYPIVDAGLRELWRTGWMHNRVRMIAASFLVKDLLLPWQWGEQWFWDTLVDADAANNTANWQWVSGCGADAAPYFRIFNPTLQGEKFDPRGHYVRHWVLELAEAPDLRIHRPETADGTLFEGGYPRPVVDHSSARRRALQAYETIKSGRRV